MASSVRDRLVKGFAAQGFAQVVNLIIQVGSVPLFLHFWGKILYGEWILLSTVPSFFALSDLGFANAAGTEMTLRMGRGDRAGALQVFQSAWVLVTLVSLLVTVTMLGVAPFLPLGAWLHVTTLTHHEIVLVVSILVFQVFFDLQTGLIGNGYRCDGNFAVGTMVRNLQRLAEFVVGAVALCLGRPPRRAGAVRHADPSAREPAFYSGCPPPQPLAGHGLASCGLGDDQADHLARLDLHGLSHRPCPEPARHGHGRGHRSWAGGRRAVLDLAHADTLCVATAERDHQYRVGGGFRRPLGLRISPSPGVCIAKPVKPRCGSRWCAAGACSLPGR